MLQKLLIDSEIIEIEDKYCKYITTVNNMLSDISEGDNEPIPMPDISIKIIKIIIQLLQHAVDCKDFCQPWQDEQTDRKQFIFSKTKYPLCPVITQELQKYSIKIVLVLLKTINKLEISILMFSVQKYISDILDNTDFDTLRSMFEISTTSLNTEQIQQLEKEASVCSIDLKKTFPSFYDLNKNI